MKKNVIKVVNLSITQTLQCGILLILTVIMMSCSTPQQAGKLQEGHLRPCPDRPNCYNSEQQGSHHTEPLQVSGDKDVAWKKVQEIIRSMGGDIKSCDDQYLWATFTSRIFRFVDDLELRYDPEQRLIHIRSGSRTGYSDLGVNNRRIEELRQRFAAFSPASPPEEGTISSSP